MGHPHIVGEYVLSIAVCVRTCLMAEESFETIHGLIRVGHVELA
jgi:hypothetical protein